MEKEKIDFAYVTGAISSQMKTSITTTTKRQQLRPTFLVTCRLLWRFDRVRVENNSARVDLAPATFTSLALPLGVSLVIAIDVGDIGKLVLDEADERVTSKAVGAGVSYHLIKSRVYI